MYLPLTLFAVFLFRLAMAIGSAAIAVMFLDFTIQIAGKGEILSTVFTGLGVMVWAAIATVFLVHE